jgi:HSP20 family molecular chaperone IbpA
MVNQLIHTSAVCSTVAAVRSTRYLRSFALSSELETDKIDANLKDGVLTLRIPKRAEVRPRRLEVRAG